MSAEPAAVHDPNFNFGYLDEQTKRMVRRAILKAIAIPGYQVPFASREMPMPYGWGTGGVQVTASILGRNDVLKVIDQGADDTTNATSIRRFFRRVTGVCTTESTREATVIQTRHRIPEAPSQEGQVIVFQASEPEAMRTLEPRETETRKLHAFADYGLMHVKLYDDVTRTGHITAVSNCPVLVNGRYLMSPKPIPSFDIAKLDGSPALHLFGAGRERRIYAVPPYTRVEAVEFEDKRFTTQRWDARCSFCGSPDSYLDEVVVDDKGGRVFVCSDTDHCRERWAKCRNDIAAEQ